MNIIQNNFNLCWTIKGRYIVEIEKEREREELLFFLFCCKIPKKKAGKQTKNSEISL